MATYTYFIDRDFPRGVNGSNLYSEIMASAIITALDKINVEGNLVYVIFKNWLSGGEREILDGNEVPAGGLIAVHDPIPRADPQEVSLANVSITDDGLLRTTPQAYTPGSQMCDRDIYLRTSQITDSFCDRRVNIATNQLVNWEEFSLLGVFKKVDGAMTPVQNQEDADMNACLTIWDLHPQDHTPAKNPIDYDLLGGSVYVDKNLAEPKNEHYCFMVAAPNIPSAYGGQVPFFDSFMFQYEGSHLDSYSPVAARMRIAKSVEATKLRIYLYYPAGAKNNHVFRVVMFRPLGTF